MKASEAFGRVPKALELSVEEAKAAMFAAGEAPRDIKQYQRGQGGNTAVVQAPIQEVSPQPSPEPVAPVLEAPVASEPPVIAEPQPPEVEKIDTLKFTAEIRQEDGQWVAEIIYKTGAGTEKFYAPSKNALLLKLVEGKGNATLRVKEAVRREKLGRPQLDSGVLVPRGMTVDQFRALPEEAQAEYQDTLETAQAMAFMESHPEFYPTLKNSADLQKYIRTRNAPITARNLEIAFEDLSDADLLDKKPEPTPHPTISASTVAPPTVDSVAAPVVPTPAPAVVAPPTEPAPVMRKRGTTGLQPGHSTSVEEPATTPRAPSENELRTMPLADLKRIAERDRLARRGERR